VAKYHLREAQMTEAQKTPDARTLYATYV
jgi:hypothetical protein